MKNLIMLKGLPGSGKSTWAREYIASPMGKDTVRVNRDDIREMLYTLSSNPHRQHLEWPITKIEKDMVRILLRDGFSVIVDATNLNKKCEKGFKKLAEENGATFSIVEMKTPIEECITRDQSRTRTVGEEVISGMAKRYHIK